MKKKWITISIIAGVILIAAAIAFAVAADIRNNRPANAARSEHSLTYFYADEEGLTRFFFDDKLLDDKIAGRVDSFLSCDGSVGIARAGTGLYRIDGDGALLVYPAGVLRAALSLDNSVIAFTTSTQLHVYDHTTGELSDVKPEGVTGVPAVAVSNDGKTVAYTVKTADGKYEAYSLIDGESKKLADNAYVLAVSEGAKILWYAEPDTASLVCLKNGSKKKVAENVSGSVEFNRDLTEAIFDVASVTYASVNFKKASVLVEGASVFPTGSECGSTQGGDAAESSIADVSTLFNCVFYRSFSSSADSSARTTYNLYYIDGRRHVKELALGAYQFSVTEDGKTLSCLVDDVLYTMKPDDPGSAVKAADSIWSYGMKRDGSEYYCIGRDLRLYLLEPGALSPIPIADNVTFASLTDDGTCLYIRDFGSETGTLWSVTAHTPAEKVREGVAYAEIMKKACFAYTGLYEDAVGNKVYDVYVSANGVDFTLALSGALKNNTKD